MKARARHRSLPVACQMSTHAAAPMLPRIGPASPTRASASRVVAERAGGDHRAQERDEDRRAGLDALAPQRDHVSHLVDEQQRDEAGGERPAPEQRIGGQRDQDRAARGQQLQLRKQQQDRLELRQRPRRSPRRSRTAAGGSGPGVWRLGPRARAAARALAGGRLGRPDGGERPLRVRFHCYRL